MALDHPWTEPPAPADVRAVASGIYWLRMPLPFQLNHINLWLLDDGPGWTIVDTGVGLDDTRALGAHLRDAPRRSSGAARAGDALPSGPHGQRRLAHRALADRALVHAGRVALRAVLLAQRQRHRFRAAPRALPPARLRPGRAHTARA